MYSILVYLPLTALTADTLTSYGSMPCFQDNFWVLAENISIIVAAAGEFSNYQFITDVIQEKIISETSLNDCITTKLKTLLFWLSRTAICLQQ